MYSVFIWAICAVRLSCVHKQDKHPNLLMGHNVHNCSHKDSESSRSEVWKWTVHVSATKHEIMSWNNSEVSRCGLRNGSPNVRDAKTLGWDTHANSRREGRQICGRDFFEKGADFSVFLSWNTGQLFFHFVCLCFFSLWGNDLYFGMTVNACNITAYVAGRTNVYEYVVGGCCEKIRGRVSAWFNYFF